MTFIPSLKGEVIENLRPLGTGSNRFLMTNPFPLRDYLMKFVNIIDLVLVAGY